jgi:endonuclease-3
VQIYNPAKTVADCFKYRMPEETMVALEAKLPRHNWVEINQLLMPFGKYICTGKLPRCSTCPVLESCQRIGVDAHR